MLKFILKKHSDGSQLEVGSFATTEEGDAWVARITAPGTYGRNVDVSYLETELADNGLAPEQAVSSEVSTQPKLDEQGNPVMTEPQPILDEQGNPVLDEQGQPTMTQPEPVMQMLYHFAREWDVEVVDISADLQEAVEVDDRGHVRAGCLKIIDFIAAYNKANATPEQMGQIFSNPNFVGIVLALLTGAPTTAKALVVANGASMYPQEIVDKVVAMLAALE